MIDHLHCDAAGGGFFEGAAGVAVEGGPGVGIHSYRPSFHDGVVGGDTNFATAAIS